MDKSFRTAQFAIEGFNKPFRLDVTANSDGILFYVKRNLPCKLIGLYKFPEENQCIPIELNNSNDNLASLSIYRPPSQNIKFFLDKLSEVLEIFSKHYKNILIFGDFNATSENFDMINFINDRCRTNLIKIPNCFKSTNGTKIDRLLFQQTNSFETGISDHHHLITFMLKATFE